MHDAHSITKSRAKAVKRAPQPSILVFGHLDHAQQLLPPVANLRGQRAHARHCGPALLVAAQLQHPALHQQPLLLQRYHALGEEADQSACRRRKGEKLANTDEQSPFVSKKAMLHSLNEHGTPHNVVKTKTIWRYLGNGERALRCLQQLQEGVHGLLLRCTAACKMGCGLVVCKRRASLVHGDAERASAKWA